MLAAARGRRSATLVLRGPFGIGKTTLVDYAVAAASGFDVLRIDGVQTEAGLAFAALQRLLAPKLEGVRALPRPQRDALLSALGVSDGAPDAFLLGLGVVGLLAGASRERPLLCAVGGGEWLDQQSADVLGFVAHRPAGDAVALLVAVTDAAGSSSALDGLPELRLERLSPQEAGALLVAAAGVAVDDNVRARAVLETGGNPLALVAVARGLTHAQLAGHALLPEVLPLGRALEGHYRTYIRALPKHTRAVLLLAAIERSLTAHTLMRAAASLGIGRKALESAESAGLVSLDEDAEPPDPLLATAVYWAASAAERRRAHAALADAIDERAVDRRALHRAAAAIQPDEEVAGVLEQTAACASERGASGRAAVLLERSAHLTPDAKVRAGRILAAAEAALAAGSPAKSVSLLGAPGLQLTGRVQPARETRVQGLIDLALGTSRSVPSALLRAAHELERHDITFARDTHLAALMAALRAGALGPPGAVREAALAGRAAAPAPGQDRAVDLLLDGFVIFSLDGPGPAAPILRRAICRLRDENGQHWLSVGCDAAIELWDEQALSSLATSGATPTGGASELYEVLVGRLGVAKSKLRRARLSALEAGDTAALRRAELGRLFLAAWQGSERTARELASAAVLDAAARGQGDEIGLAQSALAVLEIGLGRYGDALNAAQEATEYGTLHIAALALPELVEGAVRSGQRGAAVSAAQRLADSALAAKTEWGLGVLARSRALLETDGDPELLYLEAIAHLRRSRLTPELARTRLVYGEWLRRQRRRRDAREQLRAAHQMFWAMGASAFAQRAGSELLATGERVRERRAELMNILTAQEAHIAELAANGTSNPQIASQLQISLRTVEYHMAKVFRKLGVSSRTQLPRRLLGATDATEE